MTNGENIRKLSNEELAKLLIVRYSDFDGEEYVGVYENSIHRNIQYPRYEDCYNDVLEWLNKEIPHEE